MANRKGSQAGSGHGSALDSVRRVCRYKTPNFSDIDQVGIKPDKSCMIGQSVPTGMPLDPETAFRVAQQLAKDSCVIAAEVRLTLTFTPPPLPHISR